MKKHMLTTKRIVMIALLAALTTAGSYARITIPLDIAGTTSFHLGNIMCALSGILLGPWFGGLAAGLGSAIFDMLNPLYISECWITFLTKGTYAIVTGLVAWGFRGHWQAQNSKSLLRAYLATAAGAITYAAIYLAKSFFYNGLLLSGLAPEAAGLNLISKLPATAFNAAIAIICAPVLAFTISKTLTLNHLTTE